MIALDTHIYQAWNFPASRADFYVDACNRKKDIAAVEIGKSGIIFNSNVPFKQLFFLIKTFEHIYFLPAFGPVIVGEWSLATDNCAMWLNGFNDNLSGKFSCL